MISTQVAGVLALGLSVAPDATKDELLECMYSTAMDLDGSNGAYAGKLGANCGHELPNVAAAATDAWVKFYGALPADFAPPWRRAYATHVVRCVQINQ